MCCMIYIAFSLQMQKTAVAFKVHFVNRADAVSPLCNIYKISHTYFLDWQICMCVHMCMHTPQALGGYSLLYLSAVSKDICGAPA